MNNDNISQIEIALEIALKAHKGQRDLDGKPVILHPLTVALKGHNESEIVAGLLHDVVEDTDWTFDNYSRLVSAPRWWTRCVCSRTARMYRTLTM